MKLRKFYLCISFLFLPTILFSQLEKVTEGFQFTEGPVWKDGSILFSDIPANKIYKWNTKDGLSVFLNLQEILTVWQIVKTAVCLWHNMEKED